MMIQIQKFSLIKLKQWNENMEPVKKLTFPEHSLKFLAAIAAQIHTELHQNSFKKLQEKNRGFVFASSLPKLSAQLLIPRFTTPSFRRELTKIK